MIRVLARDNVELYFDRAKGEKVLRRISVYGDVLEDGKTFYFPPHQAPDSLAHRGLEKDLRNTTPALLLACFIVTEDIYYH